MCVLGASDVSPRAQNSPGDAEKEEPTRAAMASAARRGGMAKPPGCYGIRDFSIPGDSRLQVSGMISHREAIRIPGETEVQGQPVLQNQRWQDPWRPDPWH